MSAWEKYEKLLEVMGAELLLENLAKSIGEWALEEHLDFIARMYDVDFEEEEEEEEV